MLKNVLPFFTFGCFIVSYLTFKSSIHFNFISYDIRDYFNFFFHFLTFSHSISPTWSSEKNVFTPLCILASFITNYLTNSVWVYFWDFYPVLSSICQFLAITILFWLLQLCRIVWIQGVWFLQLCSSFSGLLWLFKVFYVS